MFINVRLQPGLVIGIGETDGHTEYHLVEWIDGKTIWLRNLRDNRMMDFSEQELLQRSSFLALDPKAAADVIPLLTQGKFADAAARTEMDQTTNLESGTPLPCKLGQKKSRLMEAAVTNPKTPGAAVGDGILTKVANKKSANMTRQEKSQQDRLYRLASGTGLKVQKYRKKGAADPLTGTFRLRDTTTKEVVNSGHERGYGFTAAQVEAYLKARKPA